MMLLFVSTISAQNVGIGTNTPTKKLSIAGGISVDQNNASTGVPDSVAITFGTIGSPAAIFSSKVPGSPTTNGLEFWTNGIPRLSITQQGTVSINTNNPDPIYAFYVAGGMRSYTFNTNTASINSSLYVTSATNSGSVNINGGAYNNAYKLTVNGGHSYFGGDGHFTGNLYGDYEIKGTTMRATQNLSVGGGIDPAYRLKVINGISRFDGDVIVDGTVNADAITTSTINGKGVVRSNGSSSLRLGFDQVSFTLTLGAGDEVDVTVNISEFDGGPGDIRVFISQFESDPLPQYANWHDFSFHVHSVNAANDTCKVRLTNTASSSRSIKGTLYLASVAKD